jgi:hypothetical protein
MENNEISTSRQDGQKDTILFFRPPDYYTDRVGEVIIERISIPETLIGDSRQFTFIISDRYGDGLCCSWVGGDKATGYTIYEGDPYNGKVVLESKFEASSREVQIFTIDGHASFGNGQQEIASESNVEIKVTITSDTYPEETGFYIEDSSKRRVVDVPPGTYTNQNVIIEEIVTLRPGLYTFTVLDTFGDGLNRLDSFYQLDLVGYDVDRLPLVTGSGAFASQESQTFLIEGDAARYPMSIHTPLGNRPQDFGFDIYRLDLVESDAIIASKARGGYELANEYAVESLFITEGGLYRIVFENSSQGLNGEIGISLGSSDPNLYNGIEYTISQEDTDNSQRWHAKFYAGVPPSSSGANFVQGEGNFLTLRMRFDRFPSEVEWILLSNTDILHVSSSTTTTSSTDIHNKGRTKNREIIAFGPEGGLYDSNLENQIIEETIVIPDHVARDSLTLIVSDSGGDGKSY